jgi:hypothetical protein
MNNIIVISKNFNSVGYYYIEGGVLGFNKTYFGENLTFQKNKSASLSG